MRHHNIRAFSHRLIIWCAIKWVYHHGYLAQGNESKWSSTLKASVWSRITCKSFDSTLTWRMAQIRFTCNLLHPRPPCSCLIYYHLLVFFYLVQLLLFWGFLRRWFCTLHKNDIKYRDIAPSWTAQILLTKPSLRPFFSSLFYFWEWDYCNGRLLSTRMTSHGALEEFHAPIHFTWTFPIF